MSISPPFLKPIYLAGMCLVLFLSSCQNQETSNNPIEIAKIDSIQIWIDQSKSVKTNPDVNSLLLNRALKEVSALSNDSLKAVYLTKLSARYLRLKDSLNFRKVNRKAILFNKKVGDSSNLGEVYWDLGAFFKKYNVQDSTYFKYREAQQIFEAIGNQRKSGQLLRKMGGVQSFVGDNIRAEATILKAIEKLKPLNEFEDISRCYSSLADNAKLLDEPEQALKDYSEALRYLEKGNASPIKMLSVKHNMALVHQRQGHHEKAIPVFLEVLAFDSLHQKKPKLCGRVLNNLGYSYLKSDQLSKLPEPFIKARRVQDSINDIGGKSSGALKLAEYYLATKDSSMALSNLNLARDLATDVGSNTHLLDILKVLPSADPKNAVAHANRFIELNDSLQKQERKIREKFGRIQFKTDEFIAENQVLTRENQLWTGIALSLFLLGLASYVIINQRVKNRILKFRQEQQANNQEIFNLMLAQSEKVEEGKKMEQKRVSEELHDGVLGKMLGARMMLLGLNKKTDPEAIAERAKAIGVIQAIEGEVRSISHELSHAAYQKIHNFILSIKDLINTVKGSSKISFDFNYSDELDWDALSGDIKINLYRIIQESIQNSVKHAECENIYINFHADEAILTVHIEDNGRGFTPKKGKKGIGMRNIASRMKKLNGTWDIKSELGKGTKVTLTIPLISNDNENAPSIIQREHNLQET
ncbi:ATP-binding protein [Maribacter sp. 2308TA10-17]|uniref:tetratricopeptide repeat-containing sensor histidine kinase n=1 Tax=Maribacter sp. 2308TA10-17 TaxID=3386276 RepID=UPI0039BC7188